MLDFEFGETFAVFVNPAIGSGRKQAEHEVSKSSEVNNRNKFDRRKSMNECSATGRKFSGEDLDWKMSTTSISQYKLIVIFLSHSV